MPLLQRLAKHDWRLEIFVSAVTLLYITLYVGGDAYNKAKVAGFLAGVNDVLRKNFHQVGVDEKNLYVKDSSENYSAYATGRDNIAKVNFNFRLAPRQNVFVWVMESLLSYFMDSVVPPVDRVDIVVTPSEEYDNFITAVVSKIGMSDHRKFNYYLALTRTTDLELLPESFVFMSEVNEIQEKTFTDKLAASLKLSMASFVKYVAFTDQPTERPETLRDLLPSRRAVLSLKLVTGKQELAQVSELLEALFDIIDKLASKEIAFKPESLRKIVKAREVEVSKIEKLLEQAKQEELADEKAAARRKERLALRNQSRDEQLKAEKKAQEKKMKKAQKKMRVRM